jgi:hypothetical protein
MPVYPHRAHVGQFADALDLLECADCALAFGDYVLGQWIVHDALRRPETVKHT